jgi:hypothetical protein
MPYQQSLVATGGNPPYLWYVLNGSLPAGMGLTGTGAIIGTPSALGTQTFTVSVGTLIPGTSSYIRASQTLSLTVSQANCSAPISPTRATFIASGGNGSITVAAPSDCAWSMSGTPSWITFSGASSGAGNATIGYQVMPNSGVDRSAAITVAGFTFTIEQQAGSIPGLSLIGSMPHIAAEENWTTTFTMVNNTSSSNQVRFSLFGSNLDASGSGNPLQLPLQTSLLTLFDASLDNTISPKCNLDRQHRRSRDRASANRLGAGQRHWRAGRIRHLPPLLRRPGNGGAADSYDAQRALVFTGVR